MRAPDVCRLRDALIELTPQHLISTADLARSQAEALRTGSGNVLMALDQQIEHTLGEKERTLGALRQHREEHGC